MAQIIMLRPGEKGKKKKLRQWQKIKTTVLLFSVSINIGFISYFIYINKDSIL